MVRLLQSSLEPSGSRSPQVCDFYPESGVCENCPGCRKNFGHFVITSFPHSQDFRLDFAAKSRSFTRNESMLNVIASVLCEAICPANDRLLRRPARKHRDSSQRLGCMTFLCGLAPLPRRDRDCVKSLNCHSERSEESRFLFRFFTSFRMTNAFY